jgi:N-carbamoyl-L-amino-acid hydrolase
MASSVERMWQDLLPVGRSRATGGYRRFAWTRADAELRDWFTAAAQERGLAVDVDRAGNQWAWLGDPDADGPGVGGGSPLDSVADGGAFDGPLGVVSAFAALDSLRDSGSAPARPLGVVNFADERGVRVPMREGDDA